MKRLCSVVLAGAFAAFAASPALARGPWWQSNPGTASFQSGGTVVPDADNNYGGQTFDVTPDGGPSWSRDSLTVNSWEGTFALRHPSLPGVQQQCNSSSRVTFTDRDAADRRTWLESLATTGAAVGDASIVCYTGANWGRDFEYFAVSFPGTDADPAGQCVTISRQVSDGRVSYTVAAPSFCLAEISRGYHDPGQPSDPGPGPEREVLNPAASAPFAFTLTLNS